MIRVLAAVIERDGRFLVCQRPVHKRYGGLWEFPGGKVEEGETDFDAASRELAEELGVRVVEVGEVEFSVRDPGTDFMIEFLRVQIEGEPEYLEHAVHAWVTREELRALPLAPSDGRYAAYLSRRERGDKEAARG